MSQFNYSDYQKMVERAQANANAGGARSKVGFFKLKNDGDKALIRLNCGSLDELEFASVHTISTNGRWIRVSCHNPFGSYDKTCPLCSAQRSGNTAISKASKKVYLEMLVSYCDPATNQYSAPEAVVWERPAMFSRDIANLLNTYGSLRDVLLLITRNGKAGDMKTTYSLMPAPTTVFKPEMIPADFSAFEGFKVNKHSYWEKTPEEIQEFLMTGSFPEVQRAAAPVQPAYNQAPVQPAYQPQPQPAVVNPANVQPVAPQSVVINPANPNPAGTPVYTAPTPAQPAPATSIPSLGVVRSTTNTVEQPAQQTAPTGERSARDFKGWSF